MLERHRHEKVARFHARLMPLVDTKSEMGDPLADRSFSATPLKYIVQKLSPENFERYAERELARFAPLPQAEIERAVDEMRRPALFLDKTPTPDATGAAGCWLGGLPTLPATVDWPWFRFGGADLVPMDFLAQINLAEWPRNPAFPQMPKQGTLLFFAARLAYHAMHGVDGSPLCRVIYVPDDISDCAPREMPQTPDLSTLPYAEEWAYHARDITTDLLKRWNIGFHPFDDIDVPSGQESTVIWRAAHDALSHITEPLGKRSAQKLRAATTNDDEDGTYAPLHQMFGCQNGGNTGSRNLLLAIENDDDRNLRDDDIEGFQFTFVNDAARAQFDLSQVYLQAESS